MARPGPRTVRRYSEEFKLTAVRLSQQPGIQVKTVAAALAIHPFMLSKWRTEARDGRLTGRARKAPPAGPARELARLQQLERDYALLKEEHDLLKKPIRFCSAPNVTPSRSSRRSARTPA
jgi:transposase